MRAVLATVAAGASGYGLWRFTWWGEDVPLWIYPPVVAFCGALAYSLDRKPGPDRGTVPWERRRLPALGAIIEALRGCHPCERLAPKRESDIETLAGELDGLGLEHPPIEPLSDPALRRLWEIYLLIFTSKVRAREAENLRAVWKETQRAAKAEESRLSSRDRMVARLINIE
ncbi:MAG: hypothetical protein OXQ94_14625 [Gemmatimonadota bacterium]|nr:hypothetical protein [Gemmatimonadota bacterium]MDE2872910.1 hypothetical protein [Gemmatimonadota bacterium]